MLKRCQLFPINSQAGFPSMCSGTGRRKGAMRQFAVNLEERVHRSSKKLTKRGGNPTRDQTLAGEKLCCSRKGRQRLAGGWPVPRGHVSAAFCTICPYFLFKIQTSFEGRNTSKIYVLCRSGAVRG